MVSKDDVLVMLKWISVWILTQFAGLNPSLQVLVWFMAIDSASGIFASIKEGRGLCSSAGSFGIFKKAGMILMLLSINRAEVALGHSYGFVAMLAVIYCINEGISITENCARLDPDAVPPGFLNVLYVLRKAQKLTLLSRINKAMAVFFGVDPNEVERGKDLIEPKPAETRRPDTL